MKNIVKLGVIALTVLSFTACYFGDKTKKPIDSTSTTVKVDSSVKTTTVDSAKNDTTKKDTTKK